MSNNLIHCCDYEWLMMDAWSTNIVQIHMLQAFYLCVKYDSYEEIFESQEITFTVLKDWHLSA